MRKEEKRKGDSEKGKVNEKETVSQRSRILGMQLDREKGGREAVRK